MTHEAADRVAALAVGLPAGPPAGSAAGLAAGSAELLDGARLRTERALAAAATRADRPPARPARRRVRWSVRPRTAGAVVVVLVAVAAVVLWRVWPAGPLDAGEAGVVVSLADPAVPSATATAGGAVLVVHVVGEVRSPGVVRLPDGARVTDAIEAAGGPTRDADLAGVNLARLVADGEQVVVPAPGSAAEAGTAALDLNAATDEELDALPGIGPVLAARIVAWRSEHGRFSTVEELAEVSGIGPALLSGLRELVRV